MALFALMESKIWLSGNFCYFIYLFFVVPSTSNLSKKSTKRMVSEEANLRLKKLKSSCECESSLYKLQVCFLYQ